MFENFDLIHRYTRAQAKMAVFTQAVAANKTKSLPADRGVPRSGQPNAFGLIAPSVFFPQPFLPQRRIADIHQRYPPIPDRQANGVSPFQAFRLAERLA